VQPNPRGLFCAVNRLIDACEDLFDLAIELSMALLSMMTCLTREAGSRPPSREWCVRTLQQLAKAHGPGQRYAASDGQVDAVELSLAGGMESDTVRLTYRGGVRGVSMLAQILEEQGVSVGTRRRGRPGI
jgi:hypothetical protein